jgi:GntR family transcriptional regulator, transcriptional repressor for pyruvate dehydrogenase complex
LRQTTTKRESIPVRVLSLAKDRAGKSVEFEPRQTKRAFEHIVEQIRNRIYNGLLVPGDRLPSERELAEQFHTARLAVREAFRVLEESGLIRIKKGKMGGAYIKEFTRKNVSQSLVDKIEDHVFSMEDLMEARAGIESLIVELAIQRITADDVKALKKNIVDTDRLISKGINSAEVQLKFHLLLARVARNSTLETVLRSILNVFGQFLMREFDPPRDHLKKHLEEHKNILETVEKRTQEQAKKQIVSHVKQSTRHFSVTNTRT